MATGRQTGKEHHHAPCSTHRMCSTTFSGKSKNLSIEALMLSANASPSSISSHW